jgi:hypothetical protein
MNPLSGRLNGMEIIRQRLRTVRLVLVVDQVEARESFAKRQPSVIAHKADARPPAGDTS